jgi:hypothetical protein
MIRHPRIRSGKYSNPTHHFQWCISFTFVSTLEICYRSASLDGAWSHTYYTNLLSLKLESHRHVNLTKTLEGNSIAIPTNYSKPDSSYPTTSSVPPNITTQSHTPQYFKIYLQKVAHTATSIPSAYTKHTQACQNYTPTLSKKLRKQHPNAPTQTTPNSRPPKKPQIGKCLLKPLKYVAPPISLTIQKSHKQNFHSPQKLYSRQTPRNPNLFPAMSSQLAGIKPQKPPTTCLSPTTTHMPKPSPPIVPTKTNSLKILTPEHPKHQKPRKSQTLAN